MENAPGRRMERFGAWGAAALGCFFDYLFYDKPPGISGLLFVGAFYTYFYRMAGRKEKPSWRADWLFLLAVGLLALTYGIYDNPVFAAFNALLLPGLMLLQTVLASRGTRRPWYRIGVIGELLERAVPGTVGQWRDAAVRLSSRLRRGREVGRPRQAMQVALGVAISLPLLAVIVALLGRADRTFADLFLGFPHFWANLPLGAWIAQTVWIVAVGGWCYGYVGGLRPARAAQPSGEDARPDPAQAVPAWAELPAGPAGPWLEPVTGGTVLAVVNAVYLLFTIVQFSYLFGAGNRELPSGMTYADYAHRGFAELVIVTVINFSLLLGLNAWTKRDSGRALAVVRLLLHLLIGFSLIMLLSAFIRLSMYQEAYGYTYLRMMVDAFMLYLLVAFMLAWLHLRRRSGPLAKQLLTAALICYIGLNYVNIDARIAEWNLQRFAKTGKIDVEYLTSLSADAVPLIMTYQRTHTQPIPGYSDEIRRMRSDSSDNHRPWMSFNLAKWRAVEALRDEGE